MLYLTTTSNPTNHGTLTIKIDDAIQKTFRTRLFTKSTGMYLIPFPKKSRYLPEKVSVKLTLFGGNKNEALLYLPATTTEQFSFYHISLQPEKGETVKLPNNVVHPLSIEKFSRSGTCRILSDADL